MVVTIIITIENKFLLSMNVVCLFTNVKEVAAQPNLN